MQWVNLSTLYEILQKTKVVWTILKLKLVFWKCWKADYYFTSVIATAWAFIFSTGKETKSRQYFDTCAMLKTLYNGVKLETHHEEFLGEC